MESSLEKATGRILLKCSAPLSYLNTSANSGWSGAALTHIKSSGQGEFTGCWSALLLSYNLSSPSAYFILDAQGRRQRPSNRLNLLPPKEERRGGWDWEGKSINLFIQPDFVERVLGLPFDSSHMLDHFVTKRDDPFLEFLMQALLADLQAGSPNGSLPSESVVAAIVQRLQNESAHDILNRRCKPMPQQLVKRAQEYIESRLHESLHLDEIAANVGLSVRQLSRLFRTHGGCSPYEYIIRRRVNRAIESIRVRNYSLESIAATTGFASHKHMTSSFRRILGKTPSQFRCNEN